MKGLMWIGLAFVLLFSLNIQPAAAWYSTNYGNRTSINITVSSGSTVAGYQIPYNITWVNGMNTSFTQLVFVNASDNTILPHCFKRNASGDRDMVAGSCLRRQT